MSPALRFSAANIDLSSRLVASTTVVASPTDNTETVIGSVAIPSGLSFATGVILVGWAAYTVGTSGVSVDLKLRQTSVAGTTVGDSGATTATAGNLGALSVWGVDLAPPAAGVYKLTMTVASGAAASTVSKLVLVAIAI